MHLKKNRGGARGGARDGGRTEEREHGKRRVQTHAEESLEMKKKKEEKRKKAKFAALKRQREVKPVPTELEYIHWWGM